MSLFDKIHAKSARIGVIGLGYVGLPLAVEKAKAGFTVTLLDLAGREGMDTLFEETKSGNGLLYAGPGCLLEEKRRSFRSIHSCCFFN